MRVTRPFSRGKSSAVDRFRGAAGGLLGFAEHREDTVPSGLCVRQTVHARAAVIPVCGMYKFWRGTEAHRPGWRGG